MVGRFSGRYNRDMVDSGYRLLAARYVRRQARQLAEQLNGLRAAEDIEFVHRARVATRRLRAALQMFDNCFAAKQIKRWQKAIRRTTTKLGNARDRDVQIEFLCGILSVLNAKECFPGIARLLVQLERDRERLQRKVVKAVDRLETKGVLQEMLQKTKRILRRAEPQPEDVQTPVALVRTQRHIHRQLKELLRHEESLADPADREGHHALRIAAKRLRYTLEIARPVYPGRLEESVEAIKRVQSLLGDIHDCDVWADHLDAFAADECDRIIGLFGHPGRFVRLQGGIDYLQADRRGCRQEVFQQLVEYWAELNRRQFWDKLEAAVQAPSEVPTAVEPAAEPLPEPATEPVAAAIAPSVASLGGNGNGNAHPAADKPLLTAGS
jgi:CHAD domain-containing protein